MKGAHAELTHSTPSFAPLPDFDATHVVVAAETTPAASSMAAALRAAGYVVTTCTHADVVGHIRKHKASELLVLDGAARPWVASALLDALRVADWTLPIILVAGRDPELRAEAERLGVEAVLDAPLEMDELRRTATRIAPLMREPRVSERSNGPPLWHS